MSEEMTPKQIAAQARKLIAQRGQQPIAGQLPYEKAPTVERPAVGKGNVRLPTSSTAPALKKAVDVDSNEIRSPKGTSTKYAYGSFDGRPIDLLLTEFGV